VEPLPATAAGTGCVRQPIIHGPASPTQAAVAGTTATALICREPIEDAPGPRPAKPTPSGRVQHHPAPRSLAWNGPRTPAARTRRSLRFIAPKACQLLTRNIDWAILAQHLGDRCCIRGVVLVSIPNPTKPWAIVLTHLKGTVPPMVSGSAVSDVGAYLQKLMTI
jgi:hypothetical protein